MTDSSHKKVAPDALKIPGPGPMQKAQGNKDLVASPGGAPSSKAQKLLAMKRRLSSSSSGESYG